MKKAIVNIFVVIIISIGFSSCYTYTYMVGDGPQIGIKTEKKNHYFINGLAPGGQSNPSEMAGDSENYQVTITHSFVDGLINILTFGIYTPTTTIITK